MLSTVAARSPNSNSTEGGGNRAVRVVPGLQVGLGAIDDAQPETGRHGRVLVVVEAATPGDFADQAHATLAARRRHFDPHFVFFGGSQRAHVQTALADIVAEAVVVFVASRAAKRDRRAVQDARAAAVVDGS